MKRLEKSNNYMLKEWIQMEYREEIWNYKWKAKDDRTNQTEMDYPNSQQ
jgi:hypothetical protein